ncbi:hypothetical protein B9Z55_000599 [Caenorhabditis nigoni]|uniref:Uncharacterized protein n=1 Tax=Caenorhabditis nigoni TaxID=1611254 RepID=A0A2G5VTW0_9PELO|nr:hypothetical protein B9Z55_000599 [Caenorhabditis nigoni]
MTRSTAERLERWKWWTDCWDMHVSSSADVWIPTDAPESRSNDHPRSENAEDTFLPNFIDEYYPSRSAVLEYISMYNIAVNYKISGTMKVVAADEDEAEYHVKDAVGNPNRCSPHFRHKEKFHSIQGHPTKRFCLVKQRVARF